MPLAKYLASITCPFLIEPTFRNFTISIYRVVLGIPEHICEDVAKCSFA